jgi:mono/diheme cytochrome c family protein
MHRRGYLLFLLLLIFTFTLPACGRGDLISEDTSEEVSDIPGEIPARYRDLTNPLRGDAEAIARGREAYQALCSQCHGADGRGDGQEAVGFDPPPGDLTRASMAEAMDGYLYWRIDEGGNFAPYNSLMPAWGTLLSETEIWELVSYLRELSGS